MVYSPTRCEIDIMRTIHAVVGDREFLYADIASIAPFPMQRMVHYEDHGWFKSKPPLKGAKPRIWRFTPGAIDLVLHGHQKTRARPQPCSG